MENVQQSPEKYLLSEYENQRIFEEEIVPVEFGNLLSVNNPSVHYFGAQPGAGKSAVLATIRQALTEQDGISSVASVIGDNFRAYHPNFSDLMEESDDLAAFYTDRDSGRWVEQAIVHTLQVKSHVILEGTLRNPQVTLNTAAQYQAGGFDQEMHILVVHEFVSRLRIFERYLAQVKDKGSGRYTVTEAHNRAYAALPLSLKVIAESGLFNRITLYNALGSVLFRTDGTDDTFPALETVLMSERSGDNLDFESLIAKAKQLTMYAKQVSKPRIIDDLARLTEEIHRFSR